MGIELIAPEIMPRVSGLNSPREFYGVLNEPAPLAGMSFPKQNPWDSLASIGFRSVVCLTNNTPPYDPRPLEVLKSVQFKDLLGGQYPDDPNKEADALRETVRAIVHDLHAGRGVVVHCVGGTGRAGTVIACVLRDLGVATDEVLKYMEQLNRARKKGADWTGWPESDWQFRQVTEWTSQHGW